MIGELFTAMCAETWAMRPHEMRMLSDQVHERVAFAKLPRKLPKVQGSVAIIPMYGMITQRASIWQEVFGGTATESFGAAFTAAINHPKVGGVLIDVHSPGGTISGVPELADIINRGSQIKPVATISNTLMASAAYWLGAQVGGGKKRMIAAPSAETGSIGVYRVHEDISEALALEGVKVTLLAVPEHKVEANPYEPLSDAAREHHMAQVEAGYEQFVADVARGRSVAKSVVKAGFGKGRMFNAQQAASMGLVDRVATRDEVLREFAGADVTLQAHELTTVQEELCHAWDAGMVSEMKNPAMDRRRASMDERMGYFIKRQQAPMPDGGAT